MSVVFNLPGLEKFVFSMQIKKLGFKMIKNESLD